ncbi:DUF2169 family type VI secretion system accessory protein [Agrobacterium rosae]|uniref:DUF2169 family type VI secretion system accessory protein n=1 Tax=Agrobacterium rosae TaxID=1972867 RepID=UPI000CD9ABEA|nr:DUF2169 domain-containing protein [Agrobacterium rosae]POO49126.1 hypothetical protein CTT39_24190 [Agrobacterium rosae]
MPQLVNYTPFPNFRYYSRDRQDREFGIIVVKATYELGSSGLLMVAEEQAPMVFTDLCHGAVNVTSLWHPSDMVPNKPATDIIVNAVARASGGNPQPSWTCGLRIEDGEDVRLEKYLRVTGPRYWQPQWKRRLSEGEKKEWQRHRRYFDGWVLSEPTPVADVPLHYEYAFGGEISQGHDADGKPLFDTDHRNPLGRGKVDPEWTDHTIQVAAPQIESVHERVSDPYEKMTPQNLGPIPPAWLPRRPLGGNYDQNWKDNIWPAWPPDYDFAYHNSAYPELIIKPYLKGDETVILSGFSGQSDEVRFQLPEGQLTVDLVAPNGGEDRQDMVLDTVFLDIATKKIEDWRVYLSWRLNFEVDRFEQAKIFSVKTPRVFQKIPEGA